MSSGGRTTVESMLPEQKLKKSGWVYGLYLSISSLATQVRAKQATRAPKLLGISYKKPSNFLTHDFPGRPLAISDSR